jgi:hypothetical protein
MHTKIWVLDNQHQDETAREKTKQLIKTDQQVFVWPRHLPYKDFNEMCVDRKTNQIEMEFILANTFKGMLALGKMMRK